MATPATVLAVVRAGAPAFRYRCSLGPLRELGRSRAHAIDAAQRAPARAACRTRATAAPRIPPSPRGPEDAVVYAVHAAVMAGGYALIGVGDGASLEGAQRGVCA